MNDEAVYRTAPAPPGLLNRLCHCDQELSKSQRASKSTKKFSEAGRRRTNVDATQNFPSAALSPYK